MITTKPENSGRTNKHRSLFVNLIEKRAMFFGNTSYSVVVVLEIYSIYGGTSLPATAQIIAPGDYQAGPKAKQTVPPDDRVSKQGAVPKQIGGQYAHSQRADCHSCDRRRVIWSLEHAKQRDINGHDDIDKGYGPDMGAAIDRCLGAQLE